MEMDSDWADLHAHLLESVLGKLESLKDCLVFSIVCPSWYSVAKDNQTKVVKMSQHHVPILLVPRESKDNSEWSIYNILEHNFLPTKLILPPYDRPFAGYSEGWLVTLDENLAVTLYKLYGESEESRLVHLPPVCPSMDLNLVELIAEDREFYIYKVSIFTPNNQVANPNDIVVALIFGEFRDLAYIRPAKDSQWTRVISDIHGFHDLLYYKDQFYAINNNGGKVVAFDVNLFESNAKLVIDEILSEDEEIENDIEDEEIERDNDEESDDHAEEDQEESDDVEEESEGEDEEIEGYIYDDEEESDDDNEVCLCCRKYLVESIGGELLQVRRYRKFEHVTNKFKVFKLSLDVPRWIEIKDLGDDALFLGDNTSVSVLASNFLGCQKNCIYFTHDKDTSGFGVDGPLDLGVYNLESRLVTRGFSIDAATIAQMVQRTPIWVAPTFNI